MKSHIRLLMIGGFPGLVSCSASDKGGGDTGWGDYGAMDGDGYDADADADTDTDTDTDTYDPEQEDDFLSLKPASTNAYVFVANPTRNTVTRIAVPSLDVLTTDVGIDPSVVATTTDYTMAVTFNAGTDDVSVIDAATMEVTNVAVRENFNAMVMSPDGKWVACYHDLGAEDGGASTGGTTSYNEVSFVNLDTLEHTPMVVGFNPRAIDFTDDGHMAVVVSDAYLAVVDLTADELSPERIPISDDLIEPPEAEEVLVAPNGSYAIVRQFGATELVLVDLTDLTVSSLPVGESPTDLDITPEGDQAIAVARGSHELWIYTLDDIYADPEVIPFSADEVFGSVLMSPDGTQGLLYSTASQYARYGSWDRTAADPEEAVTVRSLVKPVAAMGVSPTGGTALVFHTKENGPDVGSDSPFYDMWALTMIDLDDFFSNPLKLPSEPTAYANTEDGELGYFIMDGEPYLEMLQYDSLLYEEVKLKSNPVYLGVLPETRLAYASQEHDLGRISFYDPDSGQLKTITGFELNSGIEEY